MDKYTSPFSYLTSSLFAFLGAISREEWTFIFGIAMVVLNYLTNLHYKKKKDKRDKELTELAKKRYGNDITRDGR